MMFKVTSTPVPECFELVPRMMEDNRGYFVKTFHCDTFKALSLNTDWREEYYSVSRKGVLRGLHFQLPPHDHEKLVYCTSGEVLDVVVDLRVGSPTYSKYISFRLNSVKANMIYIPKGCAHGFYTISDSATMLYKVSTEYVPELDDGILWSSLDIAWPDSSPIVSERDKSFISLSQFNSPFRINQ